MSSEVGRSFLASLAERNGGAFTVVTGVPRRQERAGVGRKAKSMWLIVVALTCTGLEEGLLDRHEELARRIEALVAEKDGKAFDALVDIDAMLAEATRELAVTPQNVEDFKKGFKQSFSLSRHILAALQDSGTYSFLRMRRVDGRHRAVFRVVMGAGFNYHEFILSAGADDPRVQDLYVYGTGELMSQTIRRHAMNAFASSKGFVAKLLGTDREYLKNMDKMKTMKEHLDRGEFQEGLAVYEKLPSSLRSEKTYLIARLQLAAGSGDNDAYAKAIADFEKAHPKDPALDLLSIDGFLLKKQYAKAIASIDRIDKRVGGDPYLDTVRADVHIQAGDPVKAREHAERALKNDPRLQDALWSLVTISLNEKDWKETVRLLRRLEKDFGTAIDVESVPLYEEFRKTPEYAEWKRTKKPKEE